MFGLAAAQGMRLCRFGDLEDGSAKGFDPFGDGRDRLFLVRRGETLRAYLNVCPHQGASMAWRKDAYLDADGTCIVCYAHGARFDIDTGRCTQGPALGKALQPVRLSITEDGTVHAFLDTDTQRGRDI